MANQEQSQKFWGTGPHRGAENPRATHDERAAELGLELEPVGNPDMPNVRYVISKAVAPLTPIDQSPRAVLDRRAADAEARVKNREESHRLKLEALDAAKRARILEPDQPWSLQALTTARTSVDVSLDDVDAARAHRDEVVAQIKKWTTDGTIAAFEKADQEQGGDAFMKLCAPFEKRAAKLGADMGKLVVDATAAASQLMAARREATRLARVLNFANRDSGLDVGSFARRVGAAFRKSFEGAGAGNATHIVKVWTGG